MQKYNYDPTKVFCYKMCKKLKVSTKYKSMSTNDSTKDLGDLLSFT